MVRIALLVTSLSFSVLSTGALAQTFPDRPIRLVVGSAAGGVADTVCRTISLHASPRLGVPVFVENIVGANSIIALSTVQRSKPDGHTLSCGGYEGLNVLPSSRKLPYDPVKDFIPVTKMTSFVANIVVNPQLPVTTLREFFDLAKTKPGQMKYASTGIGSVVYFLGELAKLEAGVDMLHVPYKGSALAVAATMSGEVDLAFAPNSSTVGPYRAGKLKILAVTGTRRLSAIPEVPTTAEAGYTGLVGGSWQGVIAPAGVSRDVLGRLDKDLVSVANSTPFQETLDKFGGVKDVSSLETFAKEITQEREMWRRLVQKLNIELPSE